MLCLDVNVLLNTFNPNAQRHADYATAMNAWASGSEVVLVPDVVMSGFLRLVTSPRIFSPPSTPGAAWAEVDRLLAASPFRLATPGPEHWRYFRTLSDQFGASANDLPDAYIAAYAIENNATLISDDRGFSRFDNLKWRRPLDE